jgi:hypothetical protein
MKRKRLLAYLGVALLVLGALYWFCFHTSRGGSFVLYAVAGIHAPLSVRAECVFETDSRVAAKFDRKLILDSYWIEQLKGFWYYSMFRSCLFDHGYLFSGVPVSPSSLVSISTSTVRYTNHVMGFSLLLPVPAVLTIDNSLNVEYDDRLYTSKILVGTTTIIIEGFDKHEYFTSFETLTNLYMSHQLDTATVVASSTATSLSGVPVLFLAEDPSRARLVFVTKEHHIISLVFPSTTPTTVNALIENIVLQ